MNGNPIDIVSVQMSHRAIAIAFVSWVASTAASGAQPDASKIAECVHPDKRAAFVATVQAESERALRPAIEPHGLRWREATAQVDRAREAYASCLKHTKGPDQSPKEQCGELEASYRRKDAELRHLSSDAWKERVAAEMQPELERVSKRVLSEFGGCENAH